jgi:hypothetical protein
VRVPGVNVRVGPDGDVQVRKNPLASDANVTVQPR